MESLQSYAHLINSHWWIFPLLCMVIGFYYRNPRYSLYASFSMLALMCFTVMLKFQGDIKIHWVLIGLGPFYAVLLYPFLTVWHLIMAKMKIKKRR